MQVYQYNASIWRRLPAFLIDLILCDIFIMSPFDMFILTRFNAGDFKSFYSLLTSNPKLTALFYVIGFFITALILCYFILFTLLYRQTPGMMLLKIRVSPLTGGLNFWQALTRNLFLIPFFPFSLLWIIEPIHYFFSPEGQRWTERLSKTKVVQEYVIKEG